jgi:hypothetical protein
MDCDGGGNQPGVFMRHLSALLAACVVTACGAAPGERSGLVDVQPGDPSPDDEGDTPNDADAPVEGDASAPPVAPPAPVHFACADRITLDGYTQIIASAGALEPSVGNLLRVRGGQAVVDVTFVGDGDHVVLLFLANSGAKEVDLSAARTFALTYSATADLSGELRPASGEAVSLRIPSTAGALTTTTFALGGVDPAALSRARSLAFVGPGPNTLHVEGLRVDGYDPPCN